jgi:enoyl-CoA hydratase/carnithine racemase
MAERPTYFDKYETIAFERSSDGVLVVRLHTDNGPCVYGSYLHLAEWPSAFFEIGADRGNRVVVLTGTGDVFIDQHKTRPVPLKTAGDFYVPSWNVKTMLLRLLDIECPIICAINGPATIHSELVAMGQITLASETAYFADEGHFPKGEVPADGVQLVWQELLGVNRGSYFLMTGQRITAREGLALGFVNEVLAPEDLMPRAMEHAGQ